MRLIIILILIAISSFLVTSGLNRIFKKRYIKYIPAIIFAYLMLKNFITMNGAGSSGFEDLAKFARGVFWLTAGLSSLITAIAFDLYRKYKHKK
mgnify:FL=1